MAWMSRTWLIYVIVFFASFATMFLATMKSQYIFMKVAESYNTTGKGQTSCHGNASTEVDVLVARDSSRWTLILDVCLYIPASVVSLIVTAWSDKVGRKIAMTVPAAGLVLGSLSFTLTIWFNWPLETFYICNIVSGLSGYYTTLVTQGNAFLSDVVEVEKRGKRFVILESSVGVGGGIAGFVGGIWLKADGYFQPIATAFLISVVAMILIFFLPNSTKIRQETNKTEEQKKKDDQQLLGNNKTEPTTILRNDPNENDVQIRERTLLIAKDAQSRLYGSCDHCTTSDKPVPSQKSTLRELVRSVWIVYSSEYSHCEICHGARKENERLLVDRCCHGGGIYPGRIWRLWLYLICSNFYMFVFVGTAEFQTTFNLSYPLCFTPVLIGAQAGLKFLLVATAPLVVMVFQRCFTMTSNAIILTGFIGLLLSNITMSFANKPYIIFIATFILLLAFPGKPFIQAQMSSLVSQHEQGSMYALVSFTEKLSYLFSSVIFLTLYPATVEFYNGFTWIFAAIFSFLPIIPTVFIMVKDRQRAKLRIEEREPIVT